MRVLELNEFEVICDSCKAKLAATSEDIITMLGGTVITVKCPVCGNLIILDSKYV